MTESIILQVTGMKCGGCENNLNRTLSTLPGVVRVQASHQHQQVDIEFDPEQISLDDIEDAISAAGFSVTD